MTSILKEISSIINQHDSRDLLLSVIDKNGTLYYINGERKPIDKGDNDLYNSILQRMPAMAWAIDEQENLIFANDSFVKYFRLSSVKLPARIATLLPQKVIDALYTKHKDVLHTGKEIQTKQKVELADGTDITFSVSIFLLDTIRTTKVIGGHAFVFDDNNFEKELKEANDHILLLSGATTDAIWE